MMLLLPPSVCRKALPSCARSWSTSACPVAMTRHTSEQGAFSETTALPALRPCSARPQGCRGASLTRASDLDAWTRRHTSSPSPCAMPERWPLPRYAHGLPKALRLEPGVPTSDSDVVKEARISACYTQLHDSSTFRLGTEKSHLWRSKRVASRRSAQRAASWSRSSLLRHSEESGGVGDVAVAALTGPLWSWLPSNPGDGFLCQTSTGFAPLGTQTTQITQLQGLGHGSQPLAMKFGRIRARVIAPRGVRINPKP